MRRTHATIEAAVVEAWKNGAKRSHLAKRFGLHPLTVSNIAKRYGLRQRRRRDGRLSPAKEKAVIEAARKGMTARAISRKTRVAFQAVYRVAERNGLVLAPPRKCSPKLTPEVKAEIVERLRAGEKAIVLARQYKTWPAIVGALARQNGIALTRGRPRRPATVPVTVEERSARFDRRHGEGATERFLELCQTAGFKTVGMTFGFTRQYAQWMYKNLTGELKLQKQRETWLARVLEAAKTARSHKEICAMTGISYTQLLALKRRYHLDLPKAKPPGPKARITAEAIRAALVDSISQVQIAGKLHTSRWHLIKRARKFGIQLPDGRRKTKT